MHTHYVETPIGINFSVCLDTQTGVCSIATFDIRDGDFSLRFFRSFEEARNFVASLPDK